MAAEATANAPLALPSACASPLRHVDNSDSALQLLQRPFTASGARKTRLLAVLVHWGEHLDRLLLDEIDGDDDDRPDQLNTYVALRASRRSNEPHPVERNAQDLSPNSYELRSSPFATSRVVERTAHPMWNELLLVSLPIEWRQQKGAAAWVLHVDVVRRDPSQQEDTLLASAVLPLQSHAGHRTPQHFAVDLAPSTIAQLLPRLHLSIADTDDLEDSDEVLEVLIQEVKAEIPLTDTEPQTRPATVVVLATAPLDAALSVRDLFALSRIRSAILPHPGRHLWITPTATEKQADGATRSRIQWQFPTLFSRTSTGEPSTATNQLYANVYSVDRSGESYAFQCLATATLALEGVPRDGTVTRLNPTVSLLNESQQRSGSVVLRATVRCWDAHAWQSFQRTSASRRVITTNRRHRKRMALQALEWAGALCRGLNRYPVSSFCDEGGLSGFLATYLATSFQHGDTHTDSAVGDGTAVVEATESTRQVEGLLKHHISLLQLEVVAKQASISQLQREADANATALRQCGVELVAARKEVRTRDERIDQLQTTLQEVEKRDARQTRELLEATGGVIGLRLDSHGTQRLNMLIFKYKDLQERQAATERECMEAKRAVRASELLERRYAELEHAHVVQAGLVQRLQKDKSQQGELQRTIRMQEKVIGKLEKTVALAQLPSTPLRIPLATQSSQSASAPLPLTVPESDSPHLSIRVHVLEQQLESNAKAAANEIGHLKIRILELEAQLSMDVTSTMNMSPKRRPER